MLFDPDKHHRRSIRLQGYDYSQEGAYHVTICTHQRECLFGDINEDEVRLNVLGCIVAEEWERTEVVRPYVIVDEYVVMPNHLHGILIFTSDVSRRDLAVTNPISAQAKPAFGRPIAKALGTILGNFKSIVTKKINKVRETPQVAVWQNNYYDRIIRSEHALQNIRQYIELNPMRWSMDEENPANFRQDKRLP